MITRLPTQENSEGPGLSDMEYQNILTYLSSLMYPTDAMEAERKRIQRSAKKYSIFRDLLLRKNPTQRFPYHRPVPLRRQIPGVIQDNHEPLDGWTSRHVCYHTRCSLTSFELSDTRPRQRRATNICPMHQQEHPDFDVLTTTTTFWED